MNRTITRPLLAVLVGLAVAILAAAPASAHGGEGLAELTSVTRDGDQVTVTVRLTWVGDSDGVPDASITAVVGGGTPVAMTPGATTGDYTATLPAAPGEVIVVTSAAPAVSLEVPAPEATPAPTTAPAETTTTVADESTTTAPPTTEAATTTTDPDAAAEAGLTGEDDGGSATLVIGAAVAIVGAAVVIAVLVMWKKPEIDADEDTEA